MDVYSDLVDVMDSSHVIYLANHYTHLANHYTHLANHYSHLANHYIHLAQQIKLIWHGATNRWFLVHINHECFVTSTYIHVVSWGIRVQSPIAY